MVLIFMNDWGFGFVPFQLKMQYRFFKDTERKWVGQNVRPESIYLGRTFQQLGLTMSDV